MKMQQIRCRETNTIEQVIPKNQIIPDYSDCRSFPKTTEYLEKFTKPIHKKRAVTRESLVGHFLWTELYEEYLRERYRKLPGTPVTEYVDQYSKPVPNSTAGIIDKYPIYSTNAITCYNQSGATTQNFRKTYSITRPVSEQYDTQFG